MRETITSIRSPLVDNFLRIIQSLAKRGRNTFFEYLIDPLSGWSTTVPAEPMEKLMSLLDQSRRTGGKKLPLLYKMAIIKAVAPDQFDLSLPGNLSVGFLKSMKEEQRIAMSGEALEFINILREPFKEYSDKEFVRMNKKFEEEITSIGEIEVEKLIRAHEGEEAANREIEAQSAKALSKIRDMIRTAALPDIKREVIVYLLKYADPAMPNRHLAIRSVTEPLEQKHSSFMSEVMDSAAVIIYHEILKAIKDNNMLQAVRNIGTYAVLFRGNPETPNYREVDSFEKKFFKIIDEKNLWDRIR